MSLTKGNFWLTALSLVLSLAAISLLFFKKEMKIGYVNNVRLFNEFNLKLEIEKDIEKVKSLQTAQLDSLKSRMQFIEMELNSSGAPQISQSDPRYTEYRLLEIEYLKKEKQFQAENTNRAVEYDEQIWNRLNQYVLIYSEDNHYDMLLGSLGDGNLMYSKSEYDVTDNVIQFVNEKYEGK